MESIEAFCDRHGACDDDKKWALENCSTMLDVWERAKPEWLVWVATRPGVIDEKTLILFACWCVRQVRCLLKDERSKNAVIVSKKFANGQATEDELLSAWAFAGAAAGAAELFASRAAARKAWAAGFASWSAYEVARNAARAAQAKWLRENAKPNFKLAGGVR